MSHKPSIFPDEGAILIMNIMAVEYLRSLGYKRVDIRLFTLLPISSWYRHCIYHFHMVGVGASAVTCVNDLWYMNYENLEKYISSIKQGNLPINFGRKLTERELMEKWVIAKLRSTGLNKNDFKSKFGVEVEEVFGAVLHKLERLDLIKNNKLTYKGRLFAINTLGQFRYRGLISKILSIGRGSKIFKTCLAQLKMDMSVGKVLKILKDW